jgi:nucleoid-associated protein YgaU
MSRRKVFRTLVSVFAALTLALAASCASTPPKTPSAPATATGQPSEPAPETPPPVTPPLSPADQPASPSSPETPAAPATLSDSEFQAAQDAVAEAEAAEADTYSPDLINAARKALADAREKAGSPDEARALLAEAIQKAHEARDAALAGRTQALLDRLQAAVTQWSALQPDRWDPEGAAPLQARADAARDAVTADYAAGKPQADEAIAALNDAGTQLKGRLAAGQAVREEAQKALADAEAVDAYVWAPDQVQEANDAFFQGTSAWKKFHIDAAEEAWNTALFDAKAAAAKARNELARKQTEQLMLDTMKKLEDASGKTVVDPDDNIIAPQPWDGKKELEKLKKKPVSLVIPTDGTVAVMGEKQRITYLDEAKDQWSQGVRAMGDGDLTLANESFLQAQKLIDTYLAMAVDKIYTVRLIPEHRDSLWRISEYGDIYNTPWDWPKIWRRNQKLIQNPDLIYPGWQLIIPPQ